jgi:hypothetical protein
MQDLLLDVRYALRGFQTSPAFALVAVLSLALASHDLVQKGLPVSHLSLGRITQAASVGG